MNANVLNQYREFWSSLSDDIEANLKFAKAVREGDSIHQFYFFGEYSKPILKWIIINALYTSYSDEREREISGKYYEFVAGPFKDSTPQWYQLTCYKGINNEKLHSWLKRNGCQFFRKEKIREDKKEQKMSGLLEYVDYSTLINQEDFDDTFDKEELKERIKKLYSAVELLNEKDKKVIELLFFEETEWNIAWNSLSKYINPRLGKEVMQSWSSKRKQDALALLKARALKHLIINYNLLSNE